MKSKPSFTNIMTLLGAFLSGAIFWFFVSGLAKASELIQSVIAIGSIMTAVIAWRALDRWKVQFIVESRYAAAVSLDVAFRRYLRSFDRYKDLHRHCIKQKVRHEIDDAEQARDMREAYIRYVDAWGHFEHFLENCDLPKDFFLIPQNLQKSLIGILQPHNKFDTNDFCEMDDLKVASDIDELWNRGLEQIRKYKVNELKA